MQHWMDSDQVQGTCTESKPSIENVAPCTPMQSTFRLKPQSRGTPESSDRLPSLFLGIGSSERQKKGAVDTPNQLSPAPYVTLTPSSQSFCLQQPSAQAIQLAASIPSKNFQRIKLEVQREGPELHKENLLSLSLPKQERQLPVSQSLESTLGWGQGLGQPSPQGVLPGLGSSKLLFAEVVTSHEAQVPLPTWRMDCLSSRSTSQPNICPLQLMKPTSAIVMASSVPAFTNTNGSKQLSHVAKSLMVGTPVLGEETAQCISQESREMAYMYASVDNWKSCQGVLRSGTASSACTALCSCVEQDLCLTNGMHKEREKYRNFLPGAPDYFDQEQQIANGEGDNFVDSYGSGNSGKTSNSLSFQNDLASWDCQEHSEPDVFSADCPPGCNKLRNLKRKKMQFLEQLVHCTHATVATDPCTQLYGKSQRRGNCLSECSKRLELCTEDNRCKNSGISTWRETTEKHGENINTGQGECVAHQLSPYYTNGERSCSVLVASPFIARLNGSSLNNSGRVLSDLAGKFNAQSAGLKLFATSAYAQMPKALSTFSAGEPSLPLSLKLSGKLPDVRAGKTPINLGSATGADWGKCLALSATSMGNKAETDVDNILPFQQRFRQLQLFLKQCDESEQQERLQALRSLSAAARSCHAVELENRAIRLSLEEGIGPFLDPMLECIMHKF